jgi:subtilisin family serine protease
MRTPRATGDRVWVALLIAIALLVAPATAGAAGTAKYIVTLKAKPLASYTGGVSGIPATSPRRTGQRLSTTSAASRAYRTYLAGRQARALSRLSRTPRVLVEFRTALAGFAAELTAAEAAALRKAPEVLMVEKNRLWQPASYADDDLLGGDYGDGASYLNLTDPAANGIWDRFGGPRHANGAGSGVVVGVLDTGIQPNHPSFASTSAGGYVGDPFSPPPASRWSGACQNGADASFPTTACNGKLIGARYFLTGFGAGNLAPDSKRSPADDDGHGTHTSSTAAGNFGVNPQIDGSGLGVDVISGIAPRSWVAMYKVCWEGNQTTSPSGCSTLDTLNAIDAALSDGVDVINYSIGSSDSAVVGAVELAYLDAADAGVFVGVSAGNDGPGPGTVGSPAAVPWVTAAAASTLHRTFSTTAPVNGPGADDFSITGASVTGALSSSTQVVDAEHSANAGVDAIDAARCTVGSLDPAKVTDTIVLCVRGDNARVQKSKVVRDAGGVGMILYNVSDAQETVTDTHWVPTVHVNLTQGLRVKDAIAAGATTATIPAGTADTNQPSKVTAAFSSRGPQTAVPDIAKPDITAPGVNILAGASTTPSAVTDLRPGQLFQSISGTSMSSPHIAGAGALLRQAHPRTSTSPAAIKSMLMTTANPATKKEDAIAAADAFDTGSGEIDPNRAVDAGLVVDASTTDYVRYLRVVAPELFTSTGTETQPKDLNVPSISISQLAGTDSTSRTFTSLDNTAQTWSVAVTGLPGIAAAPDVASFTVAPGATHAVKVNFEVRTAPLDEYQFGALVLTNGARTVRLPISVKPVALSAPRTITVTTSRAAGSVGLAVKSGYAGSMSGVGLGLAAPDTHAGETISAGDGNPDPTGAPGSGTKIYPVAVPAGAQLLASRITNVDGGDPNTDLDMYIYRDDDQSGDFTNDEIIAQSASGIATEKVSLPDPPAGDYGVAIVGFTTNTPSSVYDLTNWLVADPSPDNPANAPGLAVTGDPASVIIGCNPALALNWSGVGSEGLYLGVVTYHNAAAPTAANAKATSIVELTKSASAPAETATPGGTPCATTSTTPGTGTPPGANPSPLPVITPTKLTLKLRSAKLVKRNRFLRIRLRTTKPVRVRAVVRRGTRTAARTTTKRVTAVTRTVRVDLRLTRHLRAGVYRVTVVGTAGNERAERRIALRVRR